MITHRVWPLESFLSQTLITEHKTIPLPSQNLDLVALAISEYEYRPAKRVQFHGFLNQQR